MLQALGAALKTDGPRGLFRGTVPLLSREVPFYVVGMTGYAYLKSVFNGEHSLRATGTAQLLALSLAGACAAVTARTEVLHFPVHSGMAVLHRGDLGDNAQARWLAT